MTKGQIIEAKIKSYFEKARAKMPGVTDDMLCGNGEIYYMNGNDGTYFDWNMNDRCCEFFMFYKSTEMGFIKLFVKKDGKMFAYMYEEDYKYGDEPIKVEEEDLGEENALYLAALLLVMADDKRKFDKAISEIDFGYEPTREELSAIQEVEDDCEEYYE